MIFAQVKRSMQLLRFTYKLYGYLYGYIYIYGYLFEHVKRTCMALSDLSILFYAEVCTFLERMEDSSPSLLCLYSLSELT